MESKDTYRPRNGSFSRENQGENRQNDKIPAQSIVGVMVVI